MKKNVIGLVAVMVSMLAAFAQGCGSSACDDFATKYKSCTCAKLTDATAKSSCEKQVDDQIAAFKAAGSADDACAAGLTQLNTSCK